MTQQYEYLRYSLRLEPEEATITYRPYSVNSDDAVSAFLRDICHLHQQPSEEFIVLAADTKGFVTDWHRVAISGINVVPIHAREVFNLRLLPMRNKSS